MYKLVSRTETNMDSEFGKAANYISRIEIQEYMFKEKEDCDEFLETINESLNLIGNLDTFDIKPDEHEMKLYFKENNELYTTTTITVTEIED